MWTKYGQHPRVSGVSLEHQRVTITDTENPFKNISSMVR